MGEVRRQDERVQVTEPWVATKALPACNGTAGTRRGRGQVGQLGRARAHGQCGEWLAELSYVRGCLEGGQTSPSMACGQAVDDALSMVLDTLQALSAAEGHLLRFGLQYQLVAEMSEVARLLYCSWDVFYFAYLTPSAAQISPIIWRSSKPVLTLNASCTTS